MRNTSIASSQIIFMLFLFIYFWFGNLFYRTKEHFLANSNSYLVNLNGKIDILIDIYFPFIFSQENILYS